MQAVSVVNNEERVRHIRLRSTAKASQGTAVEPGKLIELKPGTNLVPKEDWDAAKENPSVSLLFQTKIAPSPAPEANPERVGKMILVEGPSVEFERPLAKLSVKAASELIGETLDTGLLQAWQADEGRADIRQAIEKQLVALEPPKEPELVRPARHR